jgi:hypothetical protein
MGVRFSVLGGGPGVPDLVRGSESVKLRNVDRYMTALRDLGVEPPRASQSAPDTTARQS